MRTLAFLAVALAVAGCAEPSHGGPEPLPGLAGTPWTTEVALDSAGARSGQVAFTTAQALHAVTLAIQIDEGAFMELRFTGPGACASGGASSEGSAVFLGSNRVILDGRFGNQPFPCGDLPAGEHSISWNLTQGTFRGRAALRALAIEG